MNKKTLHIQTDFLDEDELNAPIVTVANNNGQDKLQAATFLQKLLSIILAKNFIDCWKQLKIYNPCQQKLQAYKKNLNNKRQLNSNYSRQRRVNYLESYVSIGSRLRSHSQANQFMKSSHTSQIYQEYIKPKRNKSMRILKQQIENSRANVLKQIVDKLKNARKVNNIQQKDQKNQQILSKITNLQKMVKHIKNQNSKLQSRVIKNSIYQNTSKDQNKQTRHQNDLVIVQSKDDHDEIQKSLLKQILEIKKQIQQIKLNNQIILKNQLEKSRASQNSQTNNREQINQKHNFIQKPQIQPKKIHISKDNNKNTKSIQKPNDSRQSQRTKNQIQNQKKLTIKHQQTKQIKVNQGPIENNIAHMNDNKIKNIHKIDNSQTIQIMKQFQKYSNILNQQFVNSTPINSFPFTSMTNGSSQIRQVIPQRNENITGQPFSNHNNLNKHEQFISNHNHQIQQKPPMIYQQQNQHVQIKHPKPQPIQIQVPTIQRVPSNFYLKNQQFEKKPVKILQQPISQTRPNEPPRYEPLKTNSTLYSKNIFYSDIKSSSSSGILNQQYGQYRNPSIQVQQISNNHIPIVNFTNYCSTCGRNCGCARIVHDGRRI